VNYWSRSADNLLVGKFLGVTALGYYGRAYSLMMLPVAQMSATLSAVLFPTLTTVQEDPRRFGQAWLLSTKAAWLAGAPLGMGISVTAPALVETLYGERWLPMAPVLALLAASVPAQLIGQSTGPVFQARGRTGQLFRIGLISTMLTLGAILIALPHGIAAVAAALLIKTWLGLLLPLLPALRLTGIRLRELLRTLAFGGLSTALMGAVSWSPRVFAADQAAPVILAVQVVLGAALYVPLIALGERRFLRTIRGQRSDR
jgi:PST family polysaccharide transporter